MLLIGGIRENGNISYDIEDNFNITPSNIKIWADELPYKAGDKFPTDDIKERASKYKTYKKLYNNEYNEIYANAYSLKSLEQDPSSYTQIYDLAVDLPDFRNCTEAWVDLLASKQPILNSDNDNIYKVSNLLHNCSFTEVLKNIVRGSMIMYGNKVFKVDKVDGKKPKIVDMRLSNWIPFVDKNDTSSIKVNVFFNIVVDNSGKDICEFIEYFDNGHIVKETYSYNKSAQTLGELIDKDESKAFNGAGESPIVVFKSNTIDDEVFGDSLYPRWDSAIASAIRSYMNLMTMMEKAKEAIFVAPDYATETDESTDARIIRTRGAISYHPGQDHDVSWETPDIAIDKAIEVYKQALDRLSRDTDLNIVFFDSKALGADVSAQALRTAMFRTELKATSRISEINSSLKELIHKFALINGIDLPIDQFSINIMTGFVNDKLEQSQIIKSRIGDTPTMTLVDAIMAFDPDITKPLAEIKAANILGLDKKEEDIVEDNINSVEETGDSIHFTVNENVDEPNKTNSKQDTVLVDMV